MNRIVTLTSFLIRDLFRSLAGIVPLACTLAFGLIAFEYGMDQPQFITVAGVGMGAICLATTLVLASRANRASSFLLVARLHRRTELLAALVLSSLAITTALALLMALANLLAGRLSSGLPISLVDPAHLATESGYWQHRSPCPCRGLWDGAALICLDTYCWQDC